MALSIGDVLALDVLQKAGGHLVAGASAINRRVRSVRIWRAEELRSRSHTGELLLITVASLGQKPAEVRTSVRHFAEAGAAGIALVSTGLTRRTLKPVIEEADSRGLPLIVSRDSRVENVAAGVREAIVGDQFGLLAQVEESRRSLTDLALQGVGLRRLVHSLADLVRNPVVVEDAAHQLLDFAPYSKGIQQVIRAWDGHSRSAHTEALAELGVGMSAGDVRCVWLPLSWQRNLLARIHVLEVDTSLDEIHELILENAGAALVISLISEQRFASAADKARAALLADILDGRYQTVGEILSRCKWLGAELEGQRLFAVVVQLAPAKEAIQRGPSESLTQAVAISFLVEVRAAIESVGCSGLSAMVGERILMLVGVPHEVSAEATLKAMGEEIFKRVTARFPSLRPIIGVSDQVEAESWRGAFDEANEALHFGLLSDTAPQAHHGRHLVIQRLLLRLSDGPELALLVESELGPLLESEARNGTPLLDTLAAYIESGGNKSETARRLHIERRSLYYRLGRIARQLDTDLDDTEVRTRLFLAIRGLELLRQRSFSMSDTSPAFAGIQAFNASAVYPIRSREGTRLPKDSAQVLGAANGLA